MPVFPWDPAEFFTLKYVPKDLLIKRARIAFNCLPICETPDKVLTYMEKCLSRADVGLEVLEANRTHDEIAAMVRARYWKAKNMLPPQRPSHPNKLKRRAIPKQHTKDLTP